jgi:hypothetical protein
MLKSNNLLEEDGIEDLHFYFVEFNLHKRLIMQRQKSIPGRASAGKSVLSKVTNSVQ